MSRINPVSKRRRKRDLPYLKALREAHSPESERFTPQNAILGQLAGRCVNSPGRDHHLARGDGMPKSTCSIEGCGKNHHANGYCQNHNDRSRRHGDPLYPVRDRAVGPPADRFEFYVDRRPGGCWEWTASLTAAGYAQISYDGGKVYAHRWSYEHHVGPIPDGLVIDHLCRNRGCVNPDHLEPVTTKENTLRGEAPTILRAGASRCMRGHEFSQENTYVRSNGKRVCRECKRRHHDVRFRESRR